MEESKVTTTTEAPSCCSFAYIFTNAPNNEHNRAKRDRDADKTVLQSGCTVQIKVASQPSVGVLETGTDDHHPDQAAATKALLERFDTKLLVCGGDACVPPNPLAAYGATLACEATLSIGSHLNVIQHTLTLLQKQQQAAETTTNEVKDGDSNVDTNASFLIKYGVVGSPKWSI